VIAAIAAAGCYVPRSRLPLALLLGRAARDGEAERSVAWFDEDSVTMAVAAARDCLRGRSREEIDLLIFTTTTFAFEEKQGAVIVARALGLKSAVRTVDIGHSLRGATQALSAALDAVAAGSAREALVVVADCRLGAPGSELERNGGDAAAAFVVSREAGLAKLIGSTQCSQEMIDTWRRTGDRFTHQWEERFVNQHGYLAPAFAAASELRNTYPGASRAPASSAGGSDWIWVLSAPDERSHRLLAERLQLAKEAVQPPLFGRVGYCGAAHAALQLVAALSSAARGQRLAIVNHGDGAEALLFEMVAHAAGGSLEAVLNRRWVLTSLEQFRRARDLMVTEYPVADDHGISATVHYRERDENLSLIGQRCSCGAPQFPKGRICARCGRKDQWRAENFSEATGRLLTFTLDAFYPSPEPPTAVGIVQLDDGPRIHMQIAEIAAQEVQVDLPVRFVFRRIHQVGRRPNYFWKSVPSNLDAPAAGKP
jgi:hydroxymethylglutaryl-CoA synthase